MVRDRGNQGAGGGGSVSAGGGDEGNGRFVEHRRPFHNVIKISRRWGLERRCRVLVERLDKVMGRWRAAVAGMTGREAGATWDYFTVLRCSVQYRGCSIEIYAVNNRRFDVFG